MFFHRKLHRLMRSRMSFLEVFVGSHNHDSHVGFSWANLEECLFKKKGTIRDIQNQTHTIHGTGIYVPT